MKILFKLSFLSLILLMSYSCKNKAADSAVKGGADVVAEGSGTTISVDNVASTVKWSGSKIGGAHYGTLNISEGQVSVDGGKVTAGNFIIDMTSLLCSDLQGDSKNKLEDHLKGSDFFDVVSFPKATFEITRVTTLENDLKGNTLVYGNLTLKDVTRQLGFKANISVSGKDVLVSVPNFNFNRTDFGIMYGSKSLADAIKDKIISDQVGISIELATKS